VPIERIPVDDPDVTINLPVIKDHGISGVTVSLAEVSSPCPYD
jgi:hypothetical protein